MTADDPLALAGALARLHGAEDLADVLPAAAAAAAALTRSARAVAALPESAGGCLAAPGYHDAGRGWVDTDLHWSPGLWPSGAVVETRDEWAGSALEPVPAICAPFRAGSHADGFLAVAGRSDGYGTGDVRLLEAVAEHVGLRLRDLDVVARFARLLGPGEPPSLDGVEIACLYAPSGVTVMRFGGDFLDFMGGGNLKQVAVAIGDVAGKGIEAASVAVAAKYAVRAVVTQMRWPPPPGEALMEANNALLEGRLAGETFVTLEIASLNARDGTLAIASAGHPTPAVLRAAGGVERPILLTAPAIGVSPEAEVHPFPTEVVDLDRGDAVLLFTDGVTEARDEQGRFYEDERLVEALEELRGLPAAQLLERLHADVVRFTRGRRLDDIAIALLRLT